MVNTKKIPTWYAVQEDTNLITPALLVYPERIENNIKKMVSIAGSETALRPHIKTHKIGEIIQLQLKYGITKFKCATIAEAELLAENKAKEVLLSMQPVGIQIERFITLIKKFPNSRFSTIADNQNSVSEISHKAKNHKIKIDLWVDLNNGMNRTGVLPNHLAVKVIQSIIESKNLFFKGLHVYDGHVNNTNLDKRNEICHQDYAKVENLIQLLSKINIFPATIVAGGTPTFPIHCKRENVETSPGTPLLWDAGYSNKFKDLHFNHAAVLATRVVSHPTTNTFCVDLGHKAVASEMNLPRVLFLNIDNTEQKSQSEEHLVVKIKSGELPKIGTLLYCIPIHICPTVAKYPKVYTVENNKITGSWTVAARDHKITI